MKIFTWEFFYNFQNHSLNLLFFYIHFISITKKEKKIGFHKNDQVIFDIITDRCFLDCFRYLGVEPRLNSGLSPGSGGDGQAQIIGAGVIGPASAEKNCKSTHLTAKQQAICSRSPPVLQVLIYRWRRYLPLVRERTNLSFSLFGLMGGEARG